MNKEFVVKGIKIIDIAYLTVLYFLIAAFVSVKTAEFQGKFDPKKFEQVSTARIFLEVIIHIIAVALFIYVVRNMVELIPFPFDGVYGFDHKKVKEINGGYVLIFVYFLFQDHLKSKIVYLFQKRIFNN